MRVEPGNAAKIAANGNSNSHWFPFQWPNDSLASFLPGIRLAESWGLTGTPDSVFLVKARAPGSVWIHSGASPFVRCACP